MPMKEYSDENIVNKDVKVTLGERLLRYLDVLVIGV